MPSQKGYVPQKGQRLPVFHMPPLEGWWVKALWGSQQPHPLAFLLTGLLLWHIILLFAISLVSIKPKRTDCQQVHSL